MSETTGLSTRDRHCPLAAVTSHDWSGWPTVSERHSPSLAALRVAVGLHPLVAVQSSDLFLGGGTGCCAPIRIRLPFGSVTANSRIHLGMSTTEVTVVPTAVKRACQASVRSVMTM